MSSPPFASFSKVFHGSVSVRRSPSDACICRTHWRTSICIVPYWVLSNWEERQDFKRLTNSPLNWSQWERSQRWPVRWPHATRVPQGGKVRRQEMLKYFAGGECLPGRCPLPQATWQEGGSLVSPLVCTALSEVMVDKISQTIRHQDDLSQRPIRTHQMKINPWASFALLNLNLHLHAAPFLSVRPNGVLTCSETYKQATNTETNKQTNTKTKKQTDKNQ